MLRKLISHLVVISFLIQLSLGLMASITSIDDENLVAMERFFKGTIPAHSHFKSQKDSTAAGGMVISEYNGKLYTLLGKRDDTGTWCNFGGKTEEGQVYLSQTGAQELMEESCGLYACPSSVLNQNPSHTLQMENITYRMYMRNFRYLKSAHFKERMGQATQESSREYADFAWVELESLLSGKPVLHPDEADRGEPFELFGDFRTMLQESAVREMLSNWGKKNLKTRHTFRRLDGPNELAAPARITWARIDGVQRTALEPSDTAFVVPYGQNAAGEKVSYKTYHKGSKKLTLAVPFNAEIERETFSHAAVKKARTLMGLKEKFSQEKEPTPIPEAWQPLVEEFRKASPTERHLKGVLKEKFVEGDSLEVYRHNIRTYLELVNDQDRMELRGKIDITEESISKLATLLHQENLALQSPTDPRFSLFHGTVAEVGELYIIFSHLKELLGANPILGSHLARADFSSTHAAPFLLNGVRGTDLYYRQFLEALGKEENKGLTAAQIFFKDFLKGFSDYDRLIVLNRLCTNPALTCGPGLGASTSNSIEYWLKGYGVEIPSIEKLFQETFALLGMRGDFVQFDSLFRQYYGISDPKDNNGFIIQMFVTPEFLSDYNHAQHTSQEDSQEAKEAYSILGHKHLHHQYSSFLSLPEDLSKHYPETWTYLPPSRPEDSVYFLSYRRDDLSKELLPQFHRELSEVCDHMATEWLMSNTKLTEGAFCGGDPLLYKLHRMASRLHAGEDIQDKPSSEALKHLVELDNFDGVEMVLRQNPESVQSLPEAEREALLVTILSKGKEKTGRLLSQVLYGSEDYVNHITERQASLVVFATIQHVAVLENLNILSQLDGRFHLKTWSQSYHDFWLSNLQEHSKVSLGLIPILGDSYVKKLLTYLTDGSYMTQNKEDILEAIKSNPGLREQINVNKNFPEFCEAFNFFDGSTKYTDYQFFRILDGLDLDWTISYGGLPLILHFVDSYSARGILNKNPALLTYRDSEGKNLRQIMEIAVIEGRLKFNPHSSDVISFPSLDSIFLGAPPQWLLIMTSLLPQQRLKFADHLKKCEELYLPFYKEKMKLKQEIDILSEEQEVRRKESHKIREDLLMLEEEEKKIYEGEHPILKPIKEEEDRLRGEARKLETTRSEAYKKIEELKGVWNILSISLKYFTAEQADDRKKLQEEARPKFLEICHSIIGPDHPMTDSEILARMLNRNLIGSIDYDNETVWEFVRFLTHQPTSYKLQADEKLRERCIKTEEFLSALRECYNTKEKTFNELRKVKEGEEDLLQQKWALLRQKEEEMTKNKKFLFEELTREGDIGPVLLSMSARHDYPVPSFYGLSEKEFNEMKEEEKETLSILEDACEKDNIKGLSLLETPRWQYLLPTILKKAGSKTPCNVMPYLLNEADLNKCVSHGTVALGSLESCLKLNWTVMKKLFKSGNIHTGYWLHKSPNPTETKREIVGHFSLEELHNLRDTYNGSLLGNILIGYGQFSPQSRIWLEPLVPAFQWEDPRSKVSYGAKFAMRVIEQNLFGIFKDLIDLRWFLTPSVTGLTVYDELPYSPDAEIVPKLTSLLKQQGLI